MNDGKKKRAQKHKNKTAFKITFDAKALQNQKKVSLNDLCLRCTQQIQWKLQYNKYKKMTQPGRCNICQQKNVYRTYMKACQSCVQQKHVCAKCLTPDYEAPQDVKISQKDQKQQQKTEYNKQIQFMKTLQQRSRRTVRRGLEKGKISWDQQQQYFVDEQGNKMAGLHFRKGFLNDEDEQGNGQDGDIMDDMDDDDMFGDDLDDDEMQEGQDEEQQNPKEKNKKQKDSSSKNRQEQQGNKQQNKNNNQQDKKGDQQQNVQQGQKSDVQGDEVDCENDLDFGEQDQDQDLDDDFEDQQEEQQIQEVPEGKKNKKNK